MTIEAESDNEARAEAMQALAEDGSLLVVLADVWPYPADIRTANSHSQADV